MSKKSPLPSQWEIPAELRKRLGATAGQQRAMFANGHLLLVLHQPPKPEELGRVGRFFWRNPAGDWQTHDPSGQVRTLEQHIQEYGRLIANLDEREDAATTSVEYFQVINDLSPMLRATRHLHQTLQDARRMVADDPQLIDFRDLAYEIERRADLLFHDTKNGMDFAVARQAEAQSVASHRMAVAAHRLNMLVAFFFPIATVSAILGVNLDHGWEHHNPPIPFYFTLACGLVCGAVLMFFIQRRPRIGR